MTNKIKVLLHGIFYPCAILRYWERALQCRDDIELKTVGTYTGSWIPWRGGMNLLPKYALSPDIPLPHHWGEATVDYEYVKPKLNGWKPDLVIDVDAARSWSSKPSEGFVVNIGTDSHCLDYSRQRSQSDLFVNMHERYAHKGDYILPYAYDPSCHYREDNVEKIYDVAMVGVEYNHRTLLANKLMAEGIKVYFHNGEIFDEYRHAHNQATIGLNWSSEDDLNARAFELPAMGNIPVMNRVTDMGLPRHEYFDYSYLFPVDNTMRDRTMFVDGAVEKVKLVLNNLEDAKKHTEEMRKLMVNETYDNRLQELLKVCGFI